MKVIVRAALCLALCTACTTGNESTTNPPSSSSSSTLISYPGTDEGARKLLTDFRSASSREEVQALRPTASDYRTVFHDPFATKAEAYYNATAWERKSTKPPEPMADPDQTEVRIWKATTEEINAWGPDATHFPGGYQKVKSQFKPGLTVYRWKYIKPGSEYGMAYDGLVHVNGHWVIFPKPWRVLDGA